MEHEETVVKIIATKKIPIDMISSSSIQARQTQVTKGLEIFAEQIRKIGLIQPIVVYQKGDKYELIVGQRRFHAHRDVLEWPEILAMIIEKPEDDMMATTISWLENEARQKMSNQDKIRHVANMHAQKTPMAEIATILGITYKEVQACIGLPRVPDKVREAVERGEIPASIAMRATDAKGFEKGRSSEAKGDDVLDLAKRILENQLTNKEQLNVIDFGQNNPDSTNDELLTDGIKNTTETINIDLQSSDMKRLERYARNNNHRTTSEAATELILDSLNQSGD